MKRKSFIANHSQCVQLILSSISVSYFTVSDAAEINQTNNTSCGWVIVTFYMRIQLDISNKGESKSSKELCSDSIFDFYYYWFDILRIIAWHVTKHLKGAEPAARWVSQIFYTDQFTTSYQMTWNETLLHIHRFFRERTRVTSAHPSYKKESETVDFLQVELSDGIVQNVSQKFWIRYSLFIFKFFWSVHFFKENEIDLPCSSSFSLQLYSLHIKWKQLFLNKKTHFKTYVREIFVSCANKYGEIRTKLLTFCLRRVWNKGNWMKIKHHQWLENINSTRTHFI